MTDLVGTQIPDVDLWVLEEGRPRTVRSTELLGTGRVVLFGVPGAFTPGCSRIHLPGYVEHADELRAQGVDEIVCVSVNDAWVMDAWGESHGARGRVTMVSDGNGELSQALGLTRDMADLGLGSLRSQRYAAIIQDGVIQRLDVDASGINATACETLLEHV